MMNTLSAWHNETIANKAVTALIKNNFNAFYCPTRQEGLQKILEWIPAGARVGVGGSLTVNEIGILDELATRGHIILNHNLPGLSGEQKMEIRHQQLSSDVFLSGTNALTLDGKLVNTDGAGNRVAAMIFGPKKVIVIAGINKIVKNTAAAEERIKAIAGPLNNKRLDTGNPCVKSGECMDCQGPGRICNVTAILNKRPLLTDITVLIIGENLGF
jgi:Uncharacterised ACR, YkgG family COG1556.